MPKLFSLETVRYLSCMLTYIFQQFMIDPTYITERIAAKIGMGDLACRLSRYDKLKRNNVNFSRRIGNYSLFLQEVESSTLRKLLMWKAARDVEEELVELQLDFPACLTRRSFQSQSIRVLHYFTNSVPFTESGYTERSLAVLRSQILAGIKPIAVTRLGYPAVIGKFWWSGMVKNPELDIRQIVPAIFPWTRKRYRASAVQKLVQIVESESVNVLHTTTSFQNAIVVSEAAKIAGIPWVYEARGQLESTWLSKLPLKLQKEARSSEKYQLSQSQEIKAMNAAGGVILLSETQKKSLASRGLKNELVSVIPNALEESYGSVKLKGRAELRRSLGLSGKRVVGIVSSIVSYEGIEVLLRATSIAQCEIVLLVAGDGEDLSRLKLLSSDLGISDRVIFAGKVSGDQIMAWYASMDVFVVPRIDSEVTRVVTPLKALKAQALGIPVIASDLPALREVTGGYAQYFKPGDEKELAVLLEGEHTTDPLAREFALGRNWQKNGQLYAEFYTRLLAREGDYTSSSGV